MRATTAVDRAEIEAVDRDAILWAIPTAKLVLDSPWVDSDSPIFCWMEAGLFARTRSAKSIEFVVAAAQKRAGGFQGQGCGPSAGDECEQVCIHSRINGNGRRVPVQFRVFIV